MNVYKPRIRRSIATVVLTTSMMSHYKCETPIWLSSFLPSSRSRTSQTIIHRLSLIPSVTPEILSTLANAIHWNAQCICWFQIWGRWINKGGGTLRDCRSIGTQVWPRWCLESNRLKADDKYSPHVLQHVWSCGRHALKSSEVHIILCTAARRVSPQS